MTIQEKARQLFQAMELRKRPDGTEYYCLKDGSPGWMREVIRHAHDGRLPDDTIYEVIADVAAVLADSDPDADIDELRDAIAEIEPDVYTYDLTAWLHDDVNNVYYLTEALEEGGIKDGFDLLSRAQYLFKQEIGNALLGALEQGVNNG